MTRTREVPNNTQKIKARTVQRPPTVENPFKTDFLGSREQSSGQRNPFEDKQVSLEVGVGIPWGCRCVISDTIKSS